MRETRERLIEWGEERDVRGPTHLARALQEEGLSVSKATISALLREKRRGCGPRTENRIRAFLGLPPAPEPTLVYPCPVCGEIHYKPKCSGKRKSRKKREGVRPSLVPKELNEERQALNVTWEEVIRMGLQAIKEKEDREDKEHRD